MELCRQRTTDRGTRAAPESPAMNVHFKLTVALLDDIVADLRRPHPFAAERAGFIGCKVSAFRSGILVLAHSYIPVPDDWYLDDPRFGCMFNADAMRAAMQ